MGHHSKKQLRPEGTLKALRHLLTSALNEGPTPRRVGYIVIIFLLIYSTLFYTAREEKTSGDIQRNTVAEKVAIPARMKPETDRPAVPETVKAKPSKRTIPAKKPIAQTSEIKTKTPAAIRKPAGKLKSDLIQKVLKPKKSPVKYTVSDNKKTFAAASMPDSKVKGVLNQKTLSPKKTPVTAMAIPQGKPAESRKESVATDVHSLANFIKLSNTGKELAMTEPEWVCVKDASNGLVWESKTKNGGLQDMNHSFSWYQSRPDPHNPSTILISGVANGGRCKGGIACDTESYVHVMNARKLCGYSDWRLPTMQEMLTLVKFSNEKASASIDTEFFPNTVASWYWTASDNKQKTEYAWYVLFRNGIPLNDLKKRPKHIRLVRGEKKTYESSREFAQQ